MSELNINDTGANREERFLGVRTTIDTDSETPEVIVDDENSQQPPAPVKKEATATPSEKPAAPDTSNTNIDDDDDDAEYSAKVKKRIKKLRWKQGEEQRRADQAEADREEAIRVAKHYMDQLQKYKSQTAQLEETINTGEATLVDNVKGRAALRVEQARDSYKRAVEEGDTEGILKANEALIQAQTAAQEAVKYDEDYKRRSAAWAQQQQIRQRQEAEAHQRWQAQQAQQQHAAQQAAQVPKPSAQATEWAEKNPWFGNDEHKEMTALAFGIHENLIKNHGMSPDTDEYFKAIDKGMQQRFPEYFAQNTNQNVNTVVVSGQRNNAATPRRVKLTASQKSIAKRLGVPLEAYARELTRGM